MFFFGATKAVFSITFVFILYILFKFVVPHKSIIQVAKNDVQLIIAPPGTNRVGATRQTDDYCIKRKFVTVPFSLANYKISIFLYIN